MMITLPKSALADSSADGEAVAPSVGDKVDLTNVVGMVKGEAGDNLMVEITAVNGAPVECDDKGEEMAEEKAPAMPMDEAGMRAAVQAEDQE